MAFVKCTKCGTKINNVTSGVIKCPSCGHTMKLAASGSNPQSNSQGQTKTQQKPTKKCKHCKSDMPVDAKVCPQCRKKQGGGCLKPVLVCLAVCIGLGVLAGVFGGESDNTQHSSKENNSVENKGDNKQEKEYKIGESWVVDGQWSLTVNSVQEAKDRNQFSDKDPAAVYIVTYTYENLGYEDSMELMEGLYFSLEDSIVDNAGKMGYSYPGDTTMYPQQTPVGASCEAQACVGVDNAGSFRIRISKYDGNGDKQKAVFNLTF